MSQEIFLTHTIDTGHRILGHKGKCARLHGHTYKIDIWMQGEVKDPGFVVDFGDVKEILNEWDHRLLLWDRDNIHHLFPTNEDIRREGIVLLPFNPTAENMAMSLCSKIRDAFNLQWVRMELWETPKSMARGQA